MVKREREKSMAKNLRRGRGRGERGSGELFCHYILEHSFLLFLPFLFFQHSVCCARGNRRRVAGANARDVAREVGRGDADCAVLFLATELAKPEARAKSDEFLSRTRV